MSSADRWERSKELFEHASALPTQDRSAYLERACGDDPALRAEVESLLASDPDASHFLDRSAPSQLGLRPKPSLRPAKEDLSGDRIGPYRLLRVIGRGGMGVVYEAKRDDDQFKQQVAIKLMREGVADLANQRFERERQILAALSHPNIARLLDGGLTESGRAYFVMEYVDGVPITRYCADRSFDVRQRLELICAVGDAVQFAHSNLVVHRDLKPDNVLVTTQGEVKLLDFGIAKLLPDEHGTHLDLTETVGRVLTPAYASPEQVTGEPVTTASDVYSLGVVLYELLTGRTPLMTDANSLEEIVRVLCTVDPIPPSAAASDFETSGATTISSSKSLRRQLTSELDSIVLMALRKEPSRRYTSAGQLTEDVRRYLTGRPVLAERDRASYRIRKFVRRNRRLAVAVGMLFVSLIGGLITTTVQRERAQESRVQAESRFDDLRTLANSLLFEIHSQIEDLPGSIEAQQLIVQRGLEYLDRLAAQSLEDPTLRREVAEAYIRLGGVQGQMTGSNLGDRSGALTSYQYALDLAEELTARDPSDLAALRTKALATEKIGDVTSLTGDLEGGVRHARGALELFSSLAEAEPDVPGHQLSAAISHVKLGDLLGHPLFPNLGDARGAVEQYEASLGRLQALPDSGGTAPGKRRYLGLVSERLGFMHRTEGRWEEARGAFERSLEIRTGLLNPSNYTSVRDVAVTQQNLCGVYPNLNEEAKAIELCLLAVATYERNAALDPASITSRADVASGLESLAHAYRATGDVPKALDALNRGLSIRQRLLEADPENVRNRQRFGRMSLELCRIASEGGVASQITIEACERGRSELLAGSGGTLSKDDAALVESALTAAGLEPAGGGSPRY